MRSMAPRSFAKQWRTPNNDSGPSLHIQTPIGIALPDLFGAMLNHLSHAPDQLPTDLSNVERRALSAFKERASVWPVPLGAGGSSGDPLDQ